MASVSEGVGALREELGGEAVAPGDPGYDEARSVWNGEIDRRPALIVRCRAAHQVADAIALARRQGSELTVRGGGHNFAGSAVADDALMIDLSPMSHVIVDPAARRARRGPISTAPRRPTASRSPAASSATPAWRASRSGAASAD
jgi:FAD/FMN-containing dehydrogenase